MNGVNNMKKALLVYNPKSGNSSQITQNMDLIATSLLKKNISLTLYSINRKYNKLVDFLKNETYDILILSGGDGTLSRCLSDLYNANIPFPKVAIFPTGTSNDLGNSLGLGASINDWINNITEGAPTPVDFGLINNKDIFLSSYAGGLFTQISYNTDKKLKKNFGKAAYYLNGLVELSNIKKFKLNLTLDNNEVIEEESILFLILNGKSVGGFGTVIDNADINDGLMNILIVKNINNPLELPNILVDFINNNLVNNNNIRTLTSKTCKIEKISENISISIDGEEGYNDDVNIEFISEKLEIFKK